jgi:hypothetical protein
LSTLPYFCLDAFSPRRCLKATEYHVLGSGFGGKLFCGRRASSRDETAQGERHVGACGRRHGEGRPGWPTGDLGSSRAPSGRVGAKAANRLSIVKPLTRYSDKWRFGAPAKSCAAMAADAKTDGGDRVARDLLRALGSKSQRLASRCACDRLGSGGESARLRGCHRSALSGGYLLSSSGRDGALSANGWR